MTLEVSARERTDSMDLSAARRAKLEADPQEAAVAAAVAVLRVSVEEVAMSLGSLAGRVLITLAAVRLEVAVEQEGQDQAVLGRRKVACATVMEVAERTSTSVF